MDPVVKKTKSKKADTVAASLDTATAADNTTTVSNDTATKQKVKRQKKIKDAVATIEATTEVAIEATKFDITSSVSELKEYCKKLGIKGYSKKNKTDLLQMVTNATTDTTA
jgi:hypothetical protein